MLQGEPGLLLHSVQVAEFMLKIQISYYSSSGKLILQYFSYEACRYLTIHAVLWHLVLKHSSDVNTVSNANIIHHWSDELPHFLTGQNVEALAIWSVSGLTLYPAICDVSAHKA